MSEQTEGKEGLISGGREGELEKGGWKKRGKKGEGLWKSLIAAAAAAL